MIKVTDLSMDARKSKAFVTQLLAKAAAAATPPPSPHTSQKTMMARIMVPLGGTPYPPPPALSTPSPLRPPPLSLTLTVPPAPVSPHPQGAIAQALTSQGPCSFRGVVEFVHSGSRIKVTFFLFFCCSNSLLAYAFSVPAKSSSARR